MRHSEVDDLTELPNYYTLIRDLEKSGKKAFVILDIDRFDDVNTIYGMGFGDEVLKKVTELLESLKPPQSKLYRVESDEFGVVIDDYKSAQVEEFAKVIESFFRTYKLPIENVEISISFTVGINYQEENLLGGAKVALKEATAEKGKSFHVYNPTSDFSKQQKDNLARVATLKKLLEKDRVIPYFQPIVDCHTKEVVKYEALARLEDDDGHIISPYFFIEAARLTGLLTAITKSMINKSLKAAQENNLSININISEHDLQEGYLVEFLKNRVKKFGIDPKEITLEVLETIAVEGNSEITKQIEELKDLGFSIALDDFGSENSNFSRLLDIHPSIIKIDGAFIKNIITDKNSGKIVKAIIYLARELDAKVVAEYVANEDIFEVIKFLGTDYAQGYAFGEPIRIDELPKK